MSPSIVSKNLANKTGKTEFHVAFGVDAQYVRSMGVTMVSLIINNPGIRFNFHVFAPFISTPDHEKLRKIEAEHNSTITIRQIDPAIFREYSKFPKFAQYSAAIFTRLLIPQALKEVTKKILYLDADILCMGDISEIVSMDMSSDIAAVVHDNGEETVKNRCQVLELTSKQYFNSGVIYINIPAWLENRISEEVMEILGQSDKKFIFPDQDALNIVLDGRAKMINEKWNFQYNLNSFLNAGDFLMGDIQQVKILHFTGRVKPWHEWSLHESRNLFLKFQSLSPWEGTPLDMPKHYKEMRLFSQFLKRRGENLEAGVWFARYLSGKLSSWCK